LFRCHYQARPAFSEMERDRRVFLWGLRHQRHPCQQHHEDTDRSGHTVLNQIDGLVSEFIRHPCQQHHEDTNRSGPNELNQIDGLVSEFIRHPCQQHHEDTLVSEFIRHPCQQHHRDRSGHTELNQIDGLVSEFIDTCYLTASKLATRRFERNSQSLTCPAPKPPVGSLQSQPVVSSRCPHR
jgi:hypothetical protein